MDKRECAEKTAYIVETLLEKNDIGDDLLLWLIAGNVELDGLFIAADSIRRRIYGDSVYLRGLIEFSNNCKNNCFYCGIRRDNKNITRYRLSKSDILDCCEKGYKLGFRTFVLQGGEDSYYSDELICDIVSSLHQKFKDCAITLSIGEKSRESYKAYYEAGAGRYLLRHETANDLHYKMLHPKEMSLVNRKRCLFDLKDIGYQVGAGFMVGSPYQKPEDLLRDIRFLQELCPDMIGIGPFITNKDTPFCNFDNGSLDLTLKMIAILRLMFPYALIPATTALGTIHPKGRELGLKAGANVVMPNLSPDNARRNYQLYDNKICTGAEDAYDISTLVHIINEIGYKIEISRGDVKRGR